VIIVYDKSTGGIVYTLDERTNYERNNLEEGQDYITSLVEHGSSALTMRVNLETKTLVTKSAILLSLDKYETAAGEPVVVEFSHEGEQFGPTFPLQVNNETVLAIPYGELQIQLTFDLPGEYVLTIPDPRIYSISKRIRVMEGIVA
jgi:hypothetical protein